jgi:uncharacterized protein (TIGR03790 family)
MSAFRSHLAWILGLGVLVVSAHTAAAQSAANLLLVVNRESAASEAVAAHYANRRGVPQENICAIHVPVVESVARDLFESQIERPIWTCIATARAQDRILYIVLTKDIPIRIVGSPGRNGTGASVDSELALLYRRRTGRSVPVVGFVPNPYYAGTPPSDSVKPFGHDLYDIYLVTRLDGYTVQDVEGLIDKGAAPVRDGQIVLDERASLFDSGGDAWLRAAAQRLSSQGLGDRVVLDESTKVLTHQSKVLGYYSWGSNDPAIHIRHFDLEFVPGALAAMFVSTDARTFKEPPPSWSPANTATRESIYGGSHQSLIGDLIRDGVTGVAGHVDEPYLDATIRPDILFPAYVSGRNLAESFYAAMPYLSWQTIVVGDPLCAPFQSAPRPSRDLDPGLDAQAELPAQFVKRRLAEMPPGVRPDAALAYIRAGGRAERHDAVGAKQSLETAVLADPRFTRARIELAELQQREGQLDRAMANYRAILEFEPNQPVALNNLAYDLATRQGHPQDALPLAERATMVAKTDPAAWDTLAWAQHLLGRDKDASVAIRQARALGGADADILWHAAVIYAAAGNTAAAAPELTAALKANPELEKREDVRKLRQELMPQK